MSKIGPYEVLETLHSGPRPLYKVKAADGRVLALKCISVEGLSDEMRERFNREAEICRALDHPNLVRVYDAGEANGILYQAMDLLGGSDLNSVFASGRHFTWPEKLSIMEQVCDGLQFAHERNMVHRDIKPANIFLEDSGHVRLLDFGMARVAESELTKVGSTLGTLNYMSPEQIRGQRCTPASDVFSAGIVFFQLASGRHPFSSRERSLAQVVSAIVFEPPPKLAETAPDAPEGLEFLLNKAMAKEPAQRFQSAGELHQAISLCRITLDLAGAEPARQPTAPPADPQVPGSPAAVPPPDGEKTRIMQRPVAPPVAAPDEAKTRVFRRGDFPPVRPQPAVPPPPSHNAPPPLPPSQPNVPPASPSPAPKLRYCPACTFANQPAATFCGGCGAALVIPSEEKTASTNWALYIAIAVAVLLAIALVVVLLVKK